MRELLENIGNVEVFLTGKHDLIRIWYKGGFAVALAIAVFSVVWIFLDSVRKGRRAIVWKVTSVVSVVLVIPSMLLWLYPSLADPSVAISVYAALDALGLLGIIGGVLGLVSVVCYAIGIGEAAVLCTVCGREMDPSWEYCPYCAVPDTPTPVEPILEEEPIAPTDILEPELMGTEGGGPGETRVLDIKETAGLAYLVQTSGMRKGVTHQLGEITSIGRDATDNDIVLDDDAVSRRHARIKLEEGEFVLYDLASANGTFVRAQRIVKRALVEGDAIKIGESTFSFMEVKEGPQA